MIPPGGLQLPPAARLPSVLDVTLTGRLRERPTHPRLPGASLPTIRALTQPAVLMVTGPEHEDGHDQGDNDDAGDDQGGDHASSSSSPNGARPFNPLTTIRNR